MKQRMLIQNDAGAGCLIHRIATASSTDDSHWMRHLAKRQGRLWPAGATAAVVAVFIAAGKADAARPCEQGRAYDASTCFAGDVPHCGGCMDGWNFGGTILVTGYRLNGTGEPYYAHPNSSLLVVRGRLARVSGLPEDLLVRGADVLVELAVERAYLHPSPESTAKVEIVMDSDLFAWRDSGISRYAFRHSVLPFVFHHANAVREGIQNLESRVAQPLDWKSEFKPPHVYSGDE